MSIQNIPSLFNQLKYVDNQIVNQKNKEILSLYELDNIPKDLQNFAKAAVIIMFVAKTVYDDIDIETSSNTNKTYMTDIIANIVNCHAKTNA